MTAALLSFEVTGRPIPQGSKTVFMVRGKPVLADANSKDLKPWRLAVTAEARRAVAGGVVAQLVGAVAVQLEFAFEKPKSVRREFPSVKPDIDKLTRSVLDGITDSGAWVDDAQVTDLRVSKRYSDIPGVHVRIGRLETEN